MDWVPDDSRYDIGLHRNWSHESYLFIWCIWRWRNKRSILLEIYSALTQIGSSEKGTKFNFLDYQLQFNETYQFIKLNEEGFNENIHW